MFNFQTSHSYLSLSFWLFLLYISFLFFYFFEWSFFLFMSIASEELGREIICTTFPLDADNSSLDMSYSPREISTVANHERIYVPYCDHNSCRVWLNKYATEAGRFIDPIMYYARIFLSNLKSSNSCILWNVVSCSIELLLFHNECVAVMSLSHRVNPHF